MRDTWPTIWLSFAEGLERLAWPCRSGPGGAGVTLANADKFRSGSSSKYMTASMAM